MHSAALMSRSVFQEVGVVTEASGRALSVETPSGRFAARRAASCLLAPAVGDQVLLAVPPEGTLYVLAVLERDEESPAIIALGADVRLEAERRLTMAAAEDIALTAGRRIRVASGAVAVSADEGTFSVKEVSWVASLVQVYASTARAVIDKVESHLETFALHATHSQRVIAGSDVTRAGTVDVQAQGTVRLRGENTFVSAEKLAKLDAELIHLG